MVGDVSCCMCIAKICIVSLIPITVNFICCTVQYVCGVRVVCCLKYCIPKTWRYSSKPSHRYVSLCVYSKRELLASVEPKKRKKCPPCAASAVFAGSFFKAGGSSNVSSACSSFRAKLSPRLKFCPNHHNCATGKRHSLR